MLFLLKIWIHKVMRDISEKERHLVESTWSGPCVGKEMSDVRINHQNSFATHYMN